MALALKPKCRIPEAQNDYGRLNDHHAVLGYLPWRFWWHTHTQTVPETWVCYGRTQMSRAPLYTKVEIIYSLTY